VVNFGTLQGAMRLINYPPYHASQATDEEKQTVDASLLNNSVIGPDSQELAMLCRCSLSTQCREVNGPEIAGFSIPNML
jgi:hypothetical protein